MDSWEDEDYVAQVVAKVPQIDAVEEQAVSKVSNKDKDDWWSSKPEKPEQPSAKQLKPKNPAAREAEPMFIVDLTRLSDSKIHSKYDRNSVNEPEAAGTLRRKVEKEYEQFAASKEHIESGTVRPCSTNVWKETLSALRDERPGHYFAPIFPPRR